MAALTRCSPRDAHGEDGGVRSGSGGAPDGQAPDGGAADAAPPPAPHAAPPPAPHAADAGPSADTPSAAAEEALRATLSPERLGVSVGAPITLWLERLREHVGARQPARLYGLDDGVDWIGAADAVLDSGWALRDHPPLEITPPLPWGVADGGDSNWHYAINAWHPLIEVLFAYEQTGVRAYLEAARAVAFDWIDFNITRNGRNDKKWYDMATGYRGEKLAFIMDRAIRDGSDAEELALLTRTALAHAEVLADPALLASGNHAVFMMLGLTALCHALPELSACDARATYADDTLTEVLSRQFFADEALHLEGAPGYHLFMSAVLAKLRDTGLFDAGGSVHRLADGAARHVHHMFHPNGDPVLIGDSGPNQLERFAALSAEARYVLSDGLEGTPPPSGPVAFPKSGYAILRSPWTETPFSEHSFLFFSGAWHDGPHNHLDHFTFEWSERGRPIVVDSGKYSYDRNAERDFFRSTRAGNSLTIDGEDLRRVSALSTLRSIGEAGALSFVDAVAARPEGVEHTRALVLHRGQWLCVADRLRASSTHQYRQWLGFHEDAVAAPEAPPGTVALSLPEGGPDVFVQSFGSGGLLEPALVKGTTGAGMQGWLSRQYGVKVPRHSLAFEQSGGDVDIVTLLALDAAPEAFAAVEVDGQLRVTWQRDGVAEGFSYAVAGDQATVEPLP